MTTNWFLFLTLFLSLAVAADLRGADKIRVGYGSLTVHYAPSGLPAMLSFTERMVLMRKFYTWKALWCGRLWSLVISPWGACPRRQWRRLDCKERTECSSPVF